MQPIGPLFANEVPSAEPAAAENELVEVEHAEAAPDAAEVSDTAEQPPEVAPADAVVEESAGGDGDEVIVEVEDVIPVSEPEVPELESGQLVDVNLQLPTEEAQVRDSDVLSEDVLIEESLETEVAEIESGTTTIVEEAISSTTEDVPEEVLVESDDVTPVQPEVSDVSGTPEDTPPEEDSVSTTTNMVVQNVDTSMSPTDDNHYLFTRDACIAMGDGTFYCQVANEKPVVLNTDRVFAAPDADGDKDIFVEREGQLTQISFNLFEDDAPYFDEVSNSIVWHRLLDGRYQIIVYDVEANEETQLTRDHYNNMEPSRFGDTTVWQGWVGNDWEIMMAEGSEVSMLTDNTDPDIAPRVTGDYIMWQAFEENAWRVKVYDRSTKQIETIADAEGASLDNPRFVLVYDAKHENGDVETKGYDLKSGEVVPLSATPAPTPQELPDPEQTGEDRALVQAPVAVKTKSETGDSEPDPESDTGTTTDDLEIIVTPYIDETLASTTADSVEAEVLEEVTQSSTVPPIADLIITPFVEEIEPTLDSQGEVASST